MLPGRTYSPEDFLRLAWRGRWLIAVPVFLCLFAALLYSRTLPDLFRSDTLIAVVPQRVPDSYVQSTVTSRVEDRLRSLTEQLLSRTRLQRVIEDLDLYPAARRTAPMQDVVEAMRRNIDVQSVGSSNRQQAGEMFHIRFTHAEPRVAMQVVERLASLFIDENSRERESQAESTNQFLDAQLADVLARLEASEKALEQFRQRHAGRLPSQMEANMQAIHTTQSQLQANITGLEGDRSRRQMLERLYNDARGEVAAPPSAAPAEADSASATPAESEASVPIPSGLDIPTQGPASQQLAQAKRLLEQAELRLKPQHPDIVRLKRVIGDLERKAEEEKNQPRDPNEQVVLSAEETRRRERLQGTRAEIESLDRQIAFKEREAERLRGVIAEYQGRIEAVPGLESEFIKLNRDYDTLNSQYQDLLKKSEGSRVAVNLERRQVGEQFRIVDAARLPERPISPDRLRISAAGLIAGLLLGLGLVAFREWRDTSFRTDGDVVEVLALPVLAVVPHVATRAERIREAQRRALVVTTALALLVVSGGAFWYLELWKYVR